MAGWGFFSGTASPESTRSKTPSSPALSRKGFTFSGLVVVARTKAIPASLASRRSLATPGLKATPSSPQKGV